MAEQDPIRLHADPRQRACVDISTLPWAASPAHGVERRLIERDGGEAARATSLVRYAPHSRFASHAHPLGEEILVLEGTFGDEFGDYPAGTYLRNPPGSSHAPRTDAGCVIFVKLRHMDPRERARVEIDTTHRVEHRSAIPGFTVMPLGGFMGERTALLRLAPGTQLPTHRHPGGMELLVLEGALEDGGTNLPRGTWLRLPPDSRTRLRSQSGCRLYAKTGHLRRLAVDLTR